jgi:type IV pilus assembly protein PilY1
MKPDPKNRALFRVLLPSAALLAAGLALALPALAQSVELATSPMTTSTTTTVKPNLMFVLDDSGSMDWDYMPDNAKNFAGNYGYNTSQCNGVYYNPAITYSPPVKPTSTGTTPTPPLNATPTTFSAAYKDGYDTSLGTTDLNTQFTGGSGSGNSGISLTPGPAFYYTYSGAQTTPAQQNYFNTSGTFYLECNSDVGSTPGSAVFTKFRLAAIPTTTITVTGAGGVTGATIKITSVSNKSAISSVRVNGLQILNGTTSQSSNANTIATNIANGINAAGVAGYSATAAGSTVTLQGPASAGGFAPVVTVSSGNAATTSTAFPAAFNTTINSITVGGVQLLPLVSGTAAGTTTTVLAADIRAKINNNTLVSGYTATVASNIVTITGPSSASNLTPVITVSSGAGSMTTTTQAFPESTPAKLQNFANWYSYYSNRMLMMKTGTGLAFDNVSDKYRVGFMTMNNNVSPGIVGVGTFDTSQRLAFYNKLYAANPGNSTPLREALSKVGQYYAHKFGTITTYKSTITVGGSGSTEVDSMKVNGIEIMEDQSVLSATTSQVAKNIAAQINAMQVTDYGATASGNVITITGPATAAGFSPVLTKIGSMTFGTTTFAGTTVTAQLNGITPADPIQYSCQQNFTILSTDGYWNGATTYNLAGGTVGQVDGTAPRPFNDGAQADTTTVTTYTRNDYSTSSTKIGAAGNNCSTSPTNKKRTLSQPQIQSCTVVSVAGVPGAEVCTAWSNNGSMVYVAPYTSDNATCVASPAVPSPDPSVRVVSGTPVVTPGFQGGVSDTLSDVAMYYYQTDLRNPALGNCTGALGQSVCEDNVFISGTDNNLKQHMTTFTLGLGARGRMVYSSSYLTDTTGDYVAVKLGSTASSTVCTWQAAGTVCNWPIPSSGAVENIDDLWHAAINGRGAFFSATDPVSLSNGLSNALTSIQSKVGSAAAAATSTLNPVAGNNQAFVASYTTLTWEGNLEARGINTDTGVVSENASWCVENVAASSCASPGSIVPDSTGDTTAYFCVTPSSVVCVGGDLVGTDCKVPVATACTGTMNAKVTDTTDTRVIKTANSAGTALIEFDTAYRAANATYFDEAKLSGLSQWPAPTDAPGLAAFRAGAVGDNLLRFLRGQHGHEYDRSSVAPAEQFYRNRQSVLGDALESQPAFIGAPLFSYPYPGYTEFLSAQASRAGTVYMGTNDGMMHAFASSTGIERWAYVPSMVISNMWKLADKQYADRHTNYVNGSPVTTDVCTAFCANAYNVLTPATNPVWKTILVAGLNGGGRGYFALDITNPASPALLWEFTTTTGIGAVKDNDLGYTFGQPVVTRKTDGTWVVLLTSGYDNGTDSATKVSGSFLANSPAGSGGGFLYVLNAGTGAILSKIATGAGTAAAPSGLAKISGYNAEASGNRASYVYGGDLLGNLWRFDINSATSAAIGTGSALKLASLFSDSAASSPQPIMTTPVLGSILGKRVVFIGTGKYLEVPDLSTTQKQTQYAIKDDDATTTLANPRTTLVQQFLIANPDGTATRLSATSASASGTGVNPVDFSSGRGWFVDLPDSRERVNIDAKLVLGTLLVPSIVPSATECSPGGSGWLNFFDYRTGGSVTTSGIASGKYDSPIVGVNVLFIDGNPVVEVVTSTEPTPKIDPTVDFKATAGGFSGKRMLWRELIPQD